ncbi:hypothetical protein D3C73_1181440 [compost metagenome]
MPGTSGARYGWCRRSRIATPMRSSRPQAKAPVSSDERLTLYTASAIVSSAGSAWRAFEVASSNSGMTTSVSRSSGGSMRITSAWLPSQAAAMIPPNREAPTLSGCFSSAVAISKIFASSSGEPIRALAATMPPIMAEALLPSPRVRGISEYMEISSSGTDTPASSNTIWATL